MTGSLALACLWAATANIIAVFPSRHHHWPAAYVLIALGIPILGWVVLQNGAIIGLLVMAAAASVLRWPVIYLWRWLRRVFARPQRPGQ